MPGAVRQGKLVLPFASADSWFWHAATLNLATEGVHDQAHDRETVGLSPGHLARRRRPGRIHIAH